MANVHPVIAGTVAQWDLQDSLVDSGPNGLDLSVSYAGTGAFADLGDVRGYKFRDIHAHNNSVLIAADSALFRDTTGNFTIECLMMPLDTTGTQILFEVAAGVGSSYYALYVPSGVEAYADNHLGGAVLVPSAGGFTTQGTLNTLHHYAWTFTNAAGVVTVAYYLDGVLQNDTTGANKTVTIPKTWAGTERLYVGGDSVPNLGTDVIMGSLRILNYARAATDIAADAAFTLGPAVEEVHSAADYITSSPEFRPFYYLKITGLPYYFFSTIDPTSSTYGTAAWTLADGYTAVRGLHLPKTQFDQSLKDLIGGIASAERVTLDVTDFGVTDSSGVYRFFQRLLAPGRFTSNTSAVYGDLTQDIEPNATGEILIVNPRGGAFVADTDTYVGGETMGITTVTPGGGIVQQIYVSERNKYPCHSGYPPCPFYRVSKLTDGSADPASGGFVSQGGPITFIGRSAALYIGHLKPDGRPEPETSSLCRIIGHIKGVTSGKDPGIYSIEIESIMADLTTAKIAPFLAHADMVGELHLPSEEDRTLKWGVHVQENGGRVYSGDATITADDGLDNIYDNAEELRKAINAKLTTSGFTITGTSASWAFSAHLGIVTTDGSPKFVLGVSTASSISTAGSPGVAQITAWMSSQPPASSTTGTLVARPPGRSLMTALGYRVSYMTATANSLTGAVAMVMQADKPVAVMYIPPNTLVPDVALKSGPDANGSRFFTDQGDGSGRAYVRFSTGHIGIILSSTSSSLSLTGIILWTSNTIAGQFTIGSLYLTATDSLSVDQVVHIHPNAIPSLAHGDGLFPCILASKGYSTDSEYNIFPVGVGLGLDGVLDKESFRNLATLLDANSIAVDIDAQTKFMDLWTGYSKERGLWLVWDPETESITLRQLELPNYASANTFTFSESNRSHENDRSEVAVDYGNLRMSWTFKYGWDPIEKKFVAPELTVNDPFAAQAYQQANRTETIEDRLVSAYSLSAMADIVGAFASRLRFTQQPWAKITRTVNKTGLLLSPGRYHKIIDNTIASPFTGIMGITTTDELYGFLYSVRSNLSDGSVTVTFLLDQTTDQTSLRPWSPTGLLDFAAGSNGYVSATGVCTMTNRFVSSTAGGVFDGLDFLVGDKVLLISYDGNSTAKSGTVTAVSASGDTVTITSGLGSVSSSVETIMILQDWASATTVRRTGASRVAFQGDGDTLLIDGTDRLHKWS